MKYFYIGKGDQLRFVVHVRTDLFVYDNLDDAINFLQHIVAHSISDPTGIYMDIRFDNESED